MRVLMRCDGGPGIGVGHVVRSLALAQEAVARGHAVDLLGRLEGEFLTGLADAVGPALRLLGPDVDLVGAAQGYDVVHVDHYELPDDVLTALAALAGDGAPRPVLSNVADGTFGARPADLLVDPTVDAEWRPAPAAADWHLRGARYVALRREVRELRGQHPDVAADRTHDGTAGSQALLRVLVVMGGADPLECAPAVVDALAATGLGLHVTVVATDATAAALTDRAARWPAGSLTVTPPVADLPGAMAVADVVVTAAGTSVWELCAMQRPMAVLAVVDNQVPGYEALLRAGGAVGLGRPADLADPDRTATVLRPLLTDATRRDQVASAAAALVDGLGAWRVVRAWEEVVGGATTRPAGAVTVRPATLADAELLWHWRNDPATRENSRSHQPVPLESHLTWLEGSLARDDRRLLVGERDGTPVGTVRWDLEGSGEWEVSITVAPECRGAGLAGPLLRAGEDWLARAAGDPATPAGAAGQQGALTAYLAVVHRDNAASRRLFLGTGYLPDLPADETGFERYVKWARSGPR